MTFKNSVIAMLMGWFLLSPVIRMEWDEFLFNFFGFFFCFMIPLLFFFIGKSIEEYRKGKNDTLDEDDVSQNKVVSEVNAVGGSS